MPPSIYLLLVPICIVTQGWSSEEKDVNAPEKTLERRKIGDIDLEIHIDIDRQTEREIDR